MVMMRKRRGLPTYEQGAHVVMGAVVLWIGACVLYAAYVTRVYTVMHDGAMMDYIALQILQGKVPYRDMVDMNFPGTYLIHMLRLWLIGPSDFAWRLWDDAYGLLAAIGMGYFCRERGRWTMLLPGLLFFACYFRMGPTQQGQREYLLLPFLVWGLALIADQLEGKGGFPKALAGFFLVGCSATIKPLPLFLGAALLLLYMKREKGVAQRVGALAGAFLLPYAMIFLWLAWVGGLAAFFDILLHIVPLYAPLGRTSLFFTLLSYGVLFLPALFFMVRVEKPKPRPVRTKLLALFVLYGVVHYVGQAKGWDYHLLPLIAALSLSTGYAAGNIFGARSMGPFVIYAQAVLLLGFFFGVHYQFYHKRLPPATDLNPQMVLDLEPWLRPGVSVQAMGQATHGIYKYLLTQNLSQATSFIYDFYFFTQPERPVVQRLRRQFLHELKTRKVRYVLVIPDYWTEGQTPEYFTRREGLIGKEYHLVLKRKYYRLYQLAPG
jgi:hypothetical protein